MPVGSIYTAKDLAITYQPLMLVTFTFRDSAASPTILRVCSHNLNSTDGFQPSGITGFPHNGQDFLARIMNQELALNQALSQQGIDVTPSVTIDMNDVDTQMWNTYERPLGFKGATMDVYCLFWNVGINDFSNNYKLIFSGRCEAGQSTEKRMVVQAISRMNMNQAFLPDTRIQKRCTNTFPDTSALVTIEATARHQEAADDESSSFFACGYSPLASGSNARGNLNAGAAFKTCNYTVSDCLLRLGNPALVWTSGGFAPLEKDLSGRVTARYSGIQWDQPTRFKSRSYADKTWIDGLNTTNEAKYNDYAPMGYGTYWVDPIVLNVVGDANMTKMEVLVSAGQVNTIRKVIVNDIDVPFNTNPAAVQQIAWFMVSTGDRTGRVNPDTIYDGSGDTYGGLCVLAITIPRQLSPSSSIPRVRCLVDGAKVRKYYNVLSASASGGIITVTISGNNSDINDGSVVTIEGCGFAAANGSWNAINGTFGSPNGTFQLQGSSATGSGSGGTVRYKYFTYNAAWIQMDVIVKGTFRYTGLNIDTFIAAAAYYDGSINYKTIFGATGSHARFRIGLGIRARVSIADLLKQMRTASRAYFWMDDTGKLSIGVKRTLADEQPSAITGSNYNTAVKSKNSAGVATNGFVAWKFSYSSVLQTAQGSGLSIDQLSSQNTPNKVSFRFIDEENGFQSDSITPIDAEDVGRVGNEINGSIPIDGVLSFDQGIRVAALYMAENYRGNNRNAATAGDTGGTYVFKIQTSFKCLHLRMGHIVMVDYPRLSLNAGLESPSGTPVNGFLARVIALKPTTNFETVEVTVSYHNDDWYVDTFGQQDAPKYTGLRRDRLTRPALPWLAWYQQPVASNVLWPVTEWGFAIKQTYELDAYGIPICRVVITGKTPINSFAGAGLSPPSIAVQGNTASVGGTIIAGQRYYIQICAKNAAGDITPPSDPDAPCVVDVPAGANTATITVPINIWHAKSTNYEVFAGRDRNRLSNQASGAVTPATTPATITLTALNESTWGMPDVEFDSILIKSKRARHLGVVGSEVLSATSTTIQLAVFTNNQFTVNQFQPAAGKSYYISLLGLYNSESYHPIADWAVVSNTGDTFTITGPNPTTIDRGDGTFGLQAKDVVIIRMRPTVGSDGTGNYVEDANWVNALNFLYDQHQITGATNASPIVLTTADPHGYVNGTKIYVQNVGGNANANGVRYAQALTATTIGLYSNVGLTTPVAGSGAYTSGGVVQEQAVGLLTNAEAGSELVIIRGTGAGTRAKINSNTPTRLYIEGGWDVTPDATSVMVILNSEWGDSVQSGSMDNSEKDSVVSLTIEMSNHLGRSFFFQAFTVDGGGNESFRPSSPFRELYVFGQPPGVRTVTINDTVVATDRLLLVDTTAAAVTIILMPSAAMFGIELTIKRISAGANNVTILPYGSELIDGAGSVTLSSQNDSLTVKGA